METYSGGYRRAPRDEFDGKKFVGLSKVNHNVVEAHDTVTLVERNPLFFVELHALSAMALIDPNTPICIDDAMKRYALLARVECFAKNCRDAL